MPVSCIVYDLDGTLIDSADDIAAAVNRTRAHYDLEPLSVDHVKTFIGDGVRRLLERALLGIVEDPVMRPARCLPKRWTDLDEVMEVFIGEYCLDPVIETTTYPGVVDALRRWYEEGVAQVVLTNKPDPIAKKVLENLGLAKYLDVIIGKNAVDDDGKPVPPKGSAEVVDYILYQTGAERDETVLVGDDRPDIATAQAGGIRCIVILGGYGNPEELAAIAPDLDLCVATFEDADVLLQGL